MKTPYPKVKRRPKKDFCPTCNMLLDAPYHVKYPCELKVKDEVK